MFDQNFIDFFKGLALNNHKDWFDENRKQYENSVKKPFQQLIRELIQKINEELDPQLILEPKQAIFRINRDIRFAKDKTPYKLHLGAAISQNGKKGDKLPGFYLHLGIGETWIGGGMFQPAKEELYKIREYMCEHPEETKEVLSRLFDNPYFSEISGDKNKIIPKEFKPYAEQIPLIFNKQFYYMKSYHDESLVLKDDLKAFIFDHFKKGNEWNQFLYKILQSDKTPH